MLEYNKILTSYKRRVGLSGDEAAVANTMLEEDLEETKRGPAGPRSLPSRSLLVAISRPLARIREYLAQNGATWDQQAQLLRELSRRKNGRTLGRNIVMLLAEIGKESESFTDAEIIARIDAWAARQSNRKAKYNRRILTRTMKVPPKKSARARKGNGLAPSLTREILPDADLEIVPTVITGLSEAERIDKERDAVIAELLEEQLRDRAKLIGLLEKE